MLTVAFGSRFELELIQIERLRTNPRRYVAR